MTGKMKDLKDLLKKVPTEMIEVDVMEEGYSKVGAYIMDKRKFVENMIENNVEVKNVKDGKIDIVFNKISYVMYICQFKVDETLSCFTKE